MEAGERKININYFWNKIKEIKNIKLILIILFLAIALITYSIVSEKIKKSDNATAVPSASVSENKTVAVNYTEEEAKLADILGYINGIGQTKVMITKDETSQCKGVIVVAEGAGKPIVEWQIRHAVQTALQIDYHSIEVYSMN